MANQNVTQLTQQTTSANTTSVFYAVINGTTDTGLPLSVFVNNLGLTGTPTTPTAALNTNTTQIASTSFVMNQAALYAPLAGATFTGPVVIPTVAVQGGTINAASVGATTPSTGAFTTLNTTGLATVNSISTASATVTGGSINSTPVGATTASTGAFTTLSASSTVSGAGFSTYLASPPAIGTTTPAAGKFTTLQATGVITPSTTAGIVGTTTNNNANAGSVGEYITATGTGVSMTSGTAANVASISLTAGDWDVVGNVEYNAAGSTTGTFLVSSISTTSATLTAAPARGALAVSLPAGFNTSVAAPITRITIASTTTVYLVGFANFAVSTLTTTGFIRARRIR